MWCILSHYLRCFFTVMYFYGMLNDKPLEPSHSRIKTLPLDRTAQAVLLLVFRSTKNSPHLCL